MKQSISFCGFCDAFRDMGRNDAFSYDGKVALFDYLEQYEEDTGEEIELDVIALCCDFTEATWEEIAADYGIDLSGCEDDDIKGIMHETVKDYLDENTIRIDVSEGVYIYQAF